MLERELSGAASGVLLHVSGAQDGATVDVPADYAAALEEIGQLKTALQSRTVIATAIGILVERRAWTSDHAFRWLVKRSQNTNTRLVDIAHTLVAEATSRAEQQARTPAEAPTVRSSSQSAGSHAISARPEPLSSPRPGGGLSIDVSPGGQPGVWCVAVAGELDIATADQLAGRIYEALLVASTVQLDLSAVTFMDACGLSVVIRAKRDAAGRGQAFHVTAAHRAVQRVLTLLRLSQLVEPQPDR